MAPFNLARCKVQIKLALQRLKMVVFKMEADAKVSRREIASLIEKGRLETARIRVENLISDDAQVELLEILELYCELLFARINLLEVSVHVDPAIADAVAGIVYAAPRTEVKELSQLRDILMNRFGRDYAIEVMENRESVVPLRVTSKLNRSTPPDSKLIELYLNEIAKAYTLPIPYTSPPPPPPPPDELTRTTTRTRHRSVSFKDDAEEVRLARASTPPDREIPKRDMNYSGASTARSFSTAHSRASTFADVEEESEDLPPPPNGLSEAGLEPVLPQSLVQHLHAHRVSPTERTRDVNFDELSARLAALKGLG